MSSGNAENFFHLCSTKLGVGSLIEPGNYGRIMRLYMADANVGSAWKVAAEQTLELERIKHFGAKPSRFESSFAFLSRSDALAQRGALGGNVCMLYEVELENPEAPRHIGIFDLVSAAYRAHPEQPFLPRVEETARQYWSGQGEGTRELLTTSRLRIVSALG
ncbi:hypothetical protein [Pandoraea sp. ISTKB]|uniref:hypothetical protein n=1 Tax=Pandoraea sp. ISTKB TaxID=1586708 RepID=UPI000846F5EB|nr:hypothetical protein [Pandoraea sp. ISTKB]ODP31554.1 hypothetical protein A9762_06030 [Pandoraea sp. ISTKB]